MRSEVARGSLVGYARVSTDGQTVAAQVAALKKAGCRRVVSETGSGGGDLPHLVRLLDELSNGDVLMVWKLDRLGRSLIRLLDLLGRLRGRGVGVKSLTEPVDTSHAAGVLLVQLLGAFAEFERASIRERCEAGRRAAVARGVRFGRPRTFDHSEAWLLRGAGLTWREVAARLGVPYGTVTSGLKRARRSERPEWGQR